MEKLFKQRKLALLFIAPQLLITLIFFYWPSLEALKQSLYQGDAFGIHSKFVGLANFIDIFSSEVYLESLKATAIFSVLVTVVTLSIGLLMAVLVNRVVKGCQYYKALLIWPYAVAPSVAGLLWRFFFNPAVGWGSRFFHYIGIDWNYLVHPGQAMFVVVIASCWQQFSYNFLFFFAGLQAIPQSLLEAASIDGANAWQRFWHIVFPLLSPTTFFLLVINVIYAFFDTFGVISVMTQGGPGRATSTLVYKVYRDGFIGQDFGASSAQSVILMLIVIGLTVVQFKYIDEKVHY